MSTDEFSLVRLIRETHEETGAADPGEIAEKVLAQLPRNMIRVALTETLRSYVVKVLSNDRSTSASSPGPSRAGVVRDWYKTWIHQPMFTGEEWKPLGECTAEDVLGAVSERREHATRTNLVADQLQKVADEVRNRHLTFVSQLPPDVVAQVTGRTP